jgi:hypothetical protein
MKNVMCLLGRHSWQHHVNPEMGGPGAGYDLCRRCGHEKKAYGPPTHASRGIPG